MSSPPSDVIDAEDTIASPLTLPEFFPLVVNGCEDAAKSFFQCLTEKSASLNDEQKDVSESLVLCSESLEKYRTCTEEYYQKKEEKRTKKKFFGLF